jgi:CheY-like chemotaxis protein
VSPRSVLVIEDDRDLREVIAEILDQGLFRVMQAADGAEALEVLRSSTKLPDLILLDLMMPVMSGMQFRAIQRTDPRLASIPVVVMSAVTEGELKASALQPVAFIAKPTDREHMLAVVARHCVTRDDVVPERQAGDAPGSGSASPAHRHA